MAKAGSQEMVSAGTLALLVMIMVSSASCTNVNYLFIKLNYTLPAAQNCMLPLKLLTCPGASAHLPLPSLSLYSPPHLQKRKRGSSLRKVWSIELWNMCNLRFEVLWNSCHGLNYDCQEGLILFEFQVPCTRGCPRGWTKASNHRQFQPSIGPIEKFPLNVDFRVFIECLSPALEVILGFKYLSN